MKIYYKKNTGKIGAPKHGEMDAKLKKKVGKPMDYFVLHGVEINYPEIDENGKQIDSNKSMVSFRFHTDSDFCKWSDAEHNEMHGGIHVRYWIYPGTDKNESELIEWALATNDVANDGKTKVKGAKVFA